MDRELMKAAIAAGIASMETAAAQMRIALEVLQAEDEPEEDEVLRCPDCQSEDLAPAGDVAVCGGCGKNVPVPATAGNKE
jgi:hypothetical protein